MGQLCKMLALMATVALPTSQAAADPPPLKATPIQHVIFIVQENRSFDHYFGTYPGANGFPAGTCVPLDPADQSKGCVMPFHDQHDVNSGGPHGALDAQHDLGDGITTFKMDGFVHSQTALGKSICSAQHAVHVRPPATCKGYAPGIDRHDVMGYHTADEIPNYWAYAKHFVLQDEFFEGVRGWSLAGHLDMTSEWSAQCTNPAVLSTCVSSVLGTSPMGNKSLYPWVNLFQLMDMHQVTWTYYLATGDEPDCADGQMTCQPQAQTSGFLSVWNPVPGFSWVQQQGGAYVAAHNPPLDRFLLDVKNGTLAQVSWVVPEGTTSEHPDSPVTTGMQYVTSLINAVMQSPYWQNTAIYLVWDDWGGFYDHVAPPNVDRNNTNTPIQGFGLRVPGLMISAYAKAGVIDHSILSFDNYAVLIENLFMDGARLDPQALGQPDNRPTIRDELTSVTFPDGTVAPLGHLISEFDFNQKPLPPLILSTHIPTTLSVSCGSTDVNNPQLCSLSNVKIDWRKVTGPEVPGPFIYQVLRDGTPLPKCASAATTCLDTAASGVHIYRVYSVDNQNVFSPPSGGVEADVP